jgi:hypothetical protein
MLQILGHLQHITTADVAAMLLIENRQAQRYVQALRIALPTLIQSMPRGTLEHIAELTQQEDDFDLWWEEAANTAAEAEEVNARAAAA